MDERSHHAVKGIAGMEAQNRRRLRSIMENSGFESYSFEAAQKEWLKHHVFIKMVKSMLDAVELLNKNNFLLVLIVADGIEYLPYLKLMRDMKPMPILVFSTTYSASEKLEAIQLGADEYLPFPM